MRRTPTPGCSVARHSHAHTPPTKHARTHAIRRWRFGKSYVCERTSAEVGHADTAAKGTQSAAHCRRRRRRRSRPDFCAVRDTRREVQRVERALGVPGRWGRRSAVANFTVATSFPLVRKSDRFNNSDAARCNRYGSRLRSVKSAQATLDSLSPAWPSSDSRTRTLAVHCGGNIIMPLVVDASKHSVPEPRRRITLHTDNFAALTR